MTEPSQVDDLERDLRRWLAAAAPLPPSDLADRIIRDTEATPQQHRWRSWLRAAIVLSAVAAFAVAVVVGIELARLLPPRTTHVADQPSATSRAVESVTPWASSAPSPSVDVLADWTECRNEVDRYSVSYPADWYANPAAPADEGTDGLAACVAFAPGPFELRPNAGVPPSVAIFFQLLAEAPPAAGKVLKEKSVMVDGREATVRELETGDGLFLPAGTRVYEYLVALDDGEVLQAATHSARVGDYREHREVLDRMLQTVQFDRRDG